MPSLFHMVTLGDRFGLGSVSRNRFLRWGCGIIAKAYTQGTGYGCERVGFCTGLCME